MGFLGTLSPPTLIEGARAEGCDWRLGRRTKGGGFRVQVERLGHKVLVIVQGFGYMNSFFGPLSLVSCGRLMPVFHTPFDRCSIARGTRNFRKKLQRLYTNYAGNIQSLWLTSCIPTGPSALTIGSEPRRRSSGLKAQVAAQLVRSGQCMGRTRELVNTAAA